MGKAGKRALALGAAAAVAIAAGCGGDGRLSKAEYEQKMRAEGQSLQTSVSGLAAAATDLNTLSTKVASIQKAFEKSANDVDAIKPPKDAEADTQKIADSLHQFSGLLGDIKSAADEQETTRVQQLFLRIQTVGREAASASNDLKKKGYDIGAFSG
jgi:hypothetical protein